jgi:hypothetical protein
MTILSRRPLAVALVAIALVVSACRAQAGASPSEIQPSPMSSASAAASVEPAPSASASEQPMPSPTPATSTDPTAPFPVIPNADADALFLDRDTCTNAEDGYRVAFPDAWWTNTAVGEVTPCNWFAPTTFDVPDPSELPPEIAITISLVDSDVGTFLEIVSRDEGIVGQTQSAIRWEERGTGTEGSEFPPSYRAYVYVVQLGPTFEEGPNVVARTDTTMAGDYELNKAVLDRIMATMELLGSID